LCGEFGRLDVAINFTYWQTAHTLYTACTGMCLPLKRILKEQDMT